MRKIILTTLWLLTSANLLSQERVSKPIPVIGKEVISELTKSTGWLLNPEGQWVSRVNKIPYSISNEYKSLIDYEKRGLGIDNFISYQLRNIKVQDSTYSILIKKYRSGYYQYSSIEEGWVENISVMYYVFSKVELNKLDNIIDNSINLIKINTLYSNSLYYNSVTYISDIEKDIVKSIDKSKTYTTSLVFHIASYKSKDIVQFQIYSTYIDDKYIGGILEEHKVKDENGKYSFDKKKIYLTDDLFKYCYYEIDSITFDKFIKISK